MAISNKEQFRKALDIIFEVHSNANFVSKGSGKLARRIEEIAKDNNVDLSDDPMMTELLDRLDCCGKIDNELLPAIAEIMCYLHKNNPNVDNLN